MLLYPFADVRARLSRGNQTSVNIIIPAETSVLSVTPQLTASQALSETPQPTRALPPMPTSSVTTTSPPTPTASSTPLFVFDLSGYDPDFFHPIDVSHNPPLIARPDEIVTLVFDLVNTIYCPEFGDTIPA